MLFLALLTLGFSASAFDLQAPRGGRGLMPENTLPAFEHALALAQLQAFELGRIQPDYPDRLREVQRQRSLPLPRPLPH